MKINFDHPLLGRAFRKLFGDKLEERFYSTFFKKTIQIENKKSNVLIYAGIGSMYLTPIEILMYHLLHEKGVGVDYFIYDKTIPANELITKNVVEAKGKDEFWNKLVERATKILKAAKVNYQFITTDSEIHSIIDNEDNSLEKLLKFRYDGIDFGNIVKGVMYRYYRSLAYGDDAQEVAMNFLITSLTNYLQVKKLYEENEYKYIMFSHGIYCTWQPVVEYCYKNKIDFICYDRSKTKGHCNFNINKPSPIWDISSSWDRLSAYQLSPMEIQKSDNYLKERELQKGDVFSYNLTEKEKDINSLKERYGIEKHRKIFTIFTNLIWDAANVSRDIAFSSPMDCIKQTIDHYQNDDRVQIIIRPHPAEMLIGSKEHYGTLVKQLFSQLPDNVTIIEPEGKVNSFSVLEMSDVAVVHTSTVGIEMAILGKPCVLISDTHYRNKGFTDDANSPKQYFQILENYIEKKPTLSERSVLAKKYFYLMMFEYQHLMPMKFTPSDVFNGYGYDSFQSLADDEHSRINKILNEIVTKKNINDFIFKNFYF